MSKAFGFDNSSNSRGTSKSFSFSMSFRRSKEHDAPETPKISPSKVKLQVELSFQDIEGTAADLMRFKVRSAREVQELWMLRSDIHQLISRQLSQQEAASRINALLPLFTHWIPAQSMVKI